MSIDQELEHKVDPNTPIIELRDLHVVFKTRTGSIFNPNKVHAVNNVNMKVMPGEVLGIVGESGSGKSTAANVMCGLQEPTEGHVFFKGEEVTKRSAGDRRKIGRVVSVVFQDPSTALNARMSVVTSSWIRSACTTSGRKRNAALAWEDLIHSGGSPAVRHDALPGQLSGGQRQRSGDRPCSRSSP